MCIGCEIQREGREARIAGKTLAACPYPMLNPLGMIWVGGWLAEDEEYVEVALALEMQTRRERA